MMTKNTSKQNNKFEGNYIVRDYAGAGREPYTDEYYDTLEIAKRAMLDTIYDDLEDDSYMCRTIELIDCSDGNETLVERVIWSDVKKMRQQARATMCYE